MEVTPYQGSVGSKKQQVTDMFNNISKSYDFLNHFLSLGIDILWRKKAIKMLKNGKVENILDVATGTGDFILESMKLNPKKVVGIDISDKMLEKAQTKIQQKGLESKVELQVADCEQLPFEAKSFDVITVGFGVRNFEHLDKGLEEMHRVLNETGTAVILEFSQPQKAPFKNLYNFYFRQILPSLGKIISGDAKAYTYLYESAKQFPSGIDFCKHLSNSGFNEIKFYPLTFGVATLYIAKK